MVFEKKKQKNKKSVVYADCCVTELIIPPLSVVMLYGISYFHLCVFIVFTVAPRLRSWCDAQQSVEAAEAPAV